MVSQLLGGGGLVDVYKVVQLVQFEPSSKFVRNFAFLKLSSLRGYFMMNTHLV